jgi:hypothetical protein
MHGRAHQQSKARILSDYSTQEMTMDDLQLEMMQLTAKGYCCSQILLLLALDAQGRENPELVRAAQGLCMGMGCGGGVCGAMTGGALLIGLYAGKGSDFEQPHKRLNLMLSELVEWFSERVGGQYGGTHCSDVMGGECREPDPARCGPIVAETFAKAMDILQAQDIDPTMPKDADHA